MWCVCGGVCVVRSDEVWWGVRCEEWWGVVCMCSSLLMIAEVGWMNIEKQIWIDCAPRSDALSRFDSKVGVQSIIHKHLVSILSVFAYNRDGLCLCICLSLLFRHCTVILIISVHLACSCCCLLLTTFVTFIQQQTNLSSLSLQLLTKVSFLLSTLKATGHWISFTYALKTATGTVTS